MPVEKTNNVFNIKATIQNVIVFFLVSKLCTVKMKKKIFKNEYIP